MPVGVRRCTWYFAKRGQIPKRGILDSRALINQLRGDEIRSIQTNVDAGLREQILKALDERGRAQDLIRQQYTGRYPFELLQNANDAAVDKKGGRVQFSVTEHSLIVADEGSGFGPDQIRAICRLGRSSKDPRKSIGYKGLGFKSVGEITDKPQIISGDVAFGFDSARTRAAVEAITGTLDETQKLPVYAFPFDLEPHDFGPDIDLIEELRDRGFRTVLRMPFRPDFTRQKVEEHIRNAITPRLLLFLDATDSLALLGTSYDFDATVTREQSGNCTETLLQSSTQTEHWLVFRHPLTGLDRALVDPIGDAWKLVEQVHVAAAVRLDEKGLPCRVGPEPLHVYFPTEEQTGLSVVLQGDFALELDRRHVGRSRETLPFNEWLASQVADLFGVVAEALADRFRFSPAVVAAFAPVGKPAGFGQVLADRCLDRLRASKFVPTATDLVCMPNDSLLLCSSIRDPAVAHKFLSVERLPGIVLPEIERDAPSRQLLGDHLGTPKLNTTEALKLLKQPAPADEVPFYEFLVDWAEEEGRTFPSMLSSTPCVRTLGGGWVAPDSNVFFPRQREEVAFPEGLQVPIVAVPDVDGLRPLLEAAGVRPFEWRQLIPEFVLPLLTSADVDESIRQTAFVALRAYYDTERTGDPRMKSQIARVLLPARNATGQSQELKPGGSLYFSHEWLGHDRLERIYGPFGDVEFLALPTPAEHDAATAARAFLEWIGVTAFPRIDERRDSYALENLNRHPHHRYGPMWMQWQSSEVSRSRSCDQGHSVSQQLGSSFALDRFPEIVATRDTDRLTLLWKELCNAWALYEPALTSEIQCNHGWHTAGNTVRTIPSLFYYMLRELEWVPTIRRHVKAVVRPERAWRITPDTPPRIIERIAVIDPALDVRSSAPLLGALGVVDAARPIPGSVVALLRDIATEFPSVADHQDQRSFLLAARWAMRTLNDVLTQGETLEPNIPLLARLDGQHVFDPKPFVASDPLLAETWEPQLPILDADRDLRRLHQALGLRILDDQIKTQPDPRGPRPDRAVAIETQIDDSKPYMAAVAIDQVPSRQSDILRGLARLEVALCDELILRYELDGQICERAQALSYIAVRIEQDGAIRRRIGTAHLELDARTDSPHWYVFGPQLADFLSVPNQGDAFALLLAASKVDRER